MKKRLFAVFLATLLVFGSIFGMALNVSATAVEAEWGPAADKMTERGTLENALDYARSYGGMVYIRLLSDINMNYTYSDVKFVLDLNGKTITSDGYTLDIRENSDVIVRDSVGGGGISTTDGGCSAVLTMEGSNIAFESGDYASPYNSVITVINGASVTIKGGSYRCGGDADLTSCISLEGDASSATLEGGVFLHNSASSAVYVTGTSTLIVKDISEAMETLVVEYDSGTIDFEPLTPSEIEKVRIIDISIDGIYTSDIRYPEGLSIMNANDPDRDNVYYIGMDTEAPVLDKVTVIRTEDTEAELKVALSDILGKYYYALVKKGSPAPVVNTDGEGYDYINSSYLKIEGLTAGAYDLYIVFRDRSGNTSEPYKIAIPAKIYGITVEDITVSDENCNDILGDRDGSNATVRYDEKTNTLILENANIESVMTEEGAVIEFLKDLTIQIKGENFITSDEYIRAIFGNVTDASLSIIGDGTLTIDVGGKSICVDASGNISVTVGDHVKIHSLSVEEGIYLTTSKGNATLTIKDDAFVKVDCSEECLYVNAYNDAKLNICDRAYVYLTTDDEEAIYVWGDDNGIITVSDEAYVFADGDEEGIDARSIVIKGGTVICYSYESDEEAIWCETLTVESGTLIAIGSIALDAEYIDIIDGSVTLMTKSIDYILFEYMLPNLDNYKGSFSPLLLTEEGYVPYTEDAARYAIGFVLAKETENIVMVAETIKKFLPPVFTKDNTFSVNEIEFKEKDFCKIIGIGINGEKHDIGDEITLENGVNVIIPIYEVEKQTDPVIDINKYCDIELHEYEGEKYFYIYSEDISVPYSGNIYLKGNSHVLYVGIYRGEHTVILDGIHVKTVSQYSYFYAVSGLLKVLVKGKNTIDNPYSIFDFDGDGKIELIIEDGGELSLNATDGNITYYADKAMKDNFSVSIADGTHAHAKKDGVLTTLKNGAEDIRKMFDEEACFIISASVLGKHQTESALKEAPTCVSEGVYYVSCEACGMLGTETFKAGNADHHYENGVCTVCNAEYPTANDGGEGTNNNVGGTTGNDDGTAKDSMNILWIILPASLLVCAGVVVCIILLRKKKN